MNFLADESVDFPIIEKLREDGHLVMAIAEMSPSISDDDVLDIANTQVMLLVTGDKDFGELIFRLNRVALGVILVRLLGLSAITKAGLVSDAIREHGSEMEGCFTVIEPGNVRIRRSFSKS
jgi:predicted nuclease of predicted toxin-antitoxin system